MSPVAVVTGAATGIGSATCGVLEKHGWEIVALDRDPMPGRDALQVDLADTGAVEHALRELPRIDGLVNNAALQLHKPLTQTTVEDWDSVAAVNTRGPFVCLKACEAQLTAAGGAVVNVASVHALETSHSMAAYAASKGALAAFTRAAAIELAPAGVRVNAVLPGAVDTGALRQGFSGRPDEKRTLVERTPLGRIGEPEEIGEAIAFLLDPARAGFITGQQLVVDGGALARLSTE